ncbi:MAG TPA: hypothetical protein PKY35_07090 [Candidatus Hydrogenedentes bacterium]|nr:hypothetical protein [Candidatus Hydrogenedentota bacterium]HOL76780.1 hypothetical protein [Candidatus Hydrogenedentota bacterium]HPO85743.1 hypothetical protein [Candidatus Hydrogenedentota bacterium]
MNSESETALSRIENAIATWKKEIAEGHNRLIQELTGLKESLAKRIQDTPMRDLAKETSEQNADIRAELAQVRAELDNLRSELLSAQQAKTNLAQECDRLRAQQTRQAQEFARLLREADELRLERDRLAAELASSSAYSEKDEEISRLKELLQEATRDREEMCRELAAAKASLEEARLALESQTDTTILRSELAEALRQRDIAREDARTLREQVERLRKSLGGEPGDAHAASAAPSLNIAAVAADGSRLRLGDILCRAGIISQKQLDEALMTQVGAPHKKLGDILIEKGYTGENVIAQVLATQLGIPFVQLSSETPELSALRSLTPKVAKLHMALPLRLSDEEIVVAMSNPLDLIAIDDIELTTRKRVSVVVAVRSEIEQAIQKYYG